MGISQGILAGGRLQPAAQSQFWQAYDALYAALYVGNGDPNFASLYPGTQDFCWECWINPQVWYNQPALIVSWALAAGSAVAGSNFSLGISPNIDGSNTIAFDAYVLGASTTRIATLPSTYWNTYIHVAFLRSGSNINVYANGTLVGQLTGFTSSLTTATTGGGAWFAFCGPVGDRDQSNPYPLEAYWRNMRYTVGNSVYGNVSSFTPPSLTANIAPVSGTQFIFWPSTTTDLTTSPIVADYATVVYQFVPYNGNAQSFYPETSLYAYPSITQLIPLVPGGAGVAGTWTTNGTGNAKPKITTVGPTPVLGNSCADFTATGTNVNITSSDSSIISINDAFCIFIWFYVPASITNEMKSILNVETTNGFVLRIGRAGQGIDWVSVAAYGGSELAYGQHIWARNAWNYLVIQRQEPGTGPGPISAWAGGNGDNYAVNLNMTDTGATGFYFANAGNVSFGCPTGSAVSSQMYFNQLMVFGSGNLNNYQAGVYDPGAATIPIVYVPSQSYPGSPMLGTFNFQGANGSTNIQPIAP
jgi:Concanavalin A-like lectin/glucanases superfamily